MAEIEAKRKAAKTLLEKKIRGSDNVEPQKGGTMQRIKVPRRIIPERSGSKYFGDAYPDLAGAAAKQVQKRKAREALRNVPLTLLVKEPRTPTSRDPLA